MSKEYFSIRNNRNRNQKLNLRNLCELINEVISEFSKNFYFAESLGFYDSYSLPGRWYNGKLGNDEDIARKLFLKVRKRNLWPIYNHYEYYSEEDLFDIIEFLWDIVRKPVYTQERIEQLYGFDIFESFDIELGRKEFSDQINAQLIDYNKDYILEKDGMIYKKSEFGVQEIFDAEPPTNDEKILIKLSDSIKKFRNRHSNEKDRKDSVRELADILEYIRPNINDLISEQDESDLFNIINNFSIRHMNQRQKENIDESIWNNWQFYIFLSTIYAYLKLKKKSI
ncbi:hypothetical protein EHQ31_00795 [Leptospira montravelensis]|uniref:Uncharacterized protein n=1 Tax=Leptospira montravelensis TaxID=2484961 RepID=A0ABY2LZY0_9LEPT|nr:hypothetical protein [Leptospira montravelensis]TGK87184.1 hypothetical protein EHQ19_00065 [Leptospira montravelensis]TGL06743.1 hypothetical protein EHQ31_00795 [Leptospira montravelensis]